MSEKEKLCPFKKTTERETNPFNGRETIHERFEVCAGKRCMAYVSNIYPCDESYCKCLESNSSKD